ncbi:hypothetical protein KAJ83_05770 [Marivibrio halodurans]|uniref:Uncharacterized protein n=1 Tax=Marivibrio halodurans TaxID=2039722 RepID=A0A8J7S6J1_9PROT|nr:hypothetical protein [Marivibrio halodurans]MBP5856507.1 hypothetical protein [Marivibrio halodurans]
MAKPATKARKGAKGGRNKGGRNKEGQKTLGAGKRFLALFIAIILVTLFFDSMILLAAGMIPTGVAYLTDRGPRKHATRTVAWMNLAGCLIVILDLWGGGGSLDHAIRLLMDPLNWVLMFGFAGIGWVIYFTLPPIVSGYLALSQEMQLKDLAKRQKALEKEWGSDVRKNAPLDRLDMIEEEIAEAERRAKAPKASGGEATDSETADSEESMGVEAGEDLTDTPAGRPVAGRHGVASGQSGRTPAKAG